jgi:DNA repair protein RecN (Recombination protein N)
MASKGNSHYLVYKDVVGKTTKSGMKLLNKEERVKEIAKMLSGDDITKASLENAKELLSK